jgi:hypothetical protein
LFFAGKLFLGFGIPQIKVSLEGVCGAFLLAGTEGKCRIPVAMDG